MERVYKKHNVLSLQQQNTLMPMTFACNCVSGVSETVIQSKDNRCCWKWRDCPGIGVSKKKKKKKISEVSMLNVNVFSANEL